MICYDFIQAGLLGFSISVSSAFLLRHAVTFHHRGLKVMFQGSLPSLDKIFFAIKKNSSFTLFNTKFFVIPKDQSLTHYHSEFLLFKMKNFPPFLQGQCMNQLSTGILSESFGLTIEVPRIASFLHLDILSSKSSIK